MSILWTLLAVWLGLCAGGMLVAGLRLSRPTAPDHTELPHGQLSHSQLSQGQAPIG